MDLNESFEKTLNLLKKHNQEHLLAFWQKLPTTQQKQDLLTQIEKLDLPAIDKWVEQYVKKETFHHLPSSFQPAPFYPAVPDNLSSSQKYDKAIRTGRQLIADGKVAAFVVAGGQGTRLGFNGPKGNYPISPVKNKTLFRIFAETILAVSKKYKTTCPWYVMTSPLNCTQTKEIFRSKNYYGLSEKDVFIFQQGTLPNFSFDGKILLADKDTIACSPDGHGGSIKALKTSGALEDMKKRGVEFLTYWQVDNPLVNLFDPLFIGLHCLDNAEMSSKGLKKEHPKEKVGNFCLADGKVTVIEYSDLPDELAQKTKPDGSLVFNMGSIGIHIISRTFVEKLNSKDFSLPFHRAVKKIPYINETGALVKPKKPNGIKLESFIFDAIPLASNSVILETLRSEEFAPVKNAEGLDSPAVTKKMMVERAAAWLESAGVKIPRKPDGSPYCLIEIAPGFAVEKSDIKTKLDQIPLIKPGDTVYLE
jgi:UDP-N-acetylglucosamine/UDP-N-acetylgalactosamine diphosphorylase